MQNKGVNLIPYELTDKEVKLIEAIRAIKLGYGKIPCVIYIQNGKLERVEFEKFFESVKL